MPDDQRDRPPGQPSTAYLMPGRRPRRPHGAGRPGPTRHVTTPSQYNLETVYKSDGNTGVAADLGVTGGLGANGPGGTVGK